jgi:hypothetical protein
MNIESIETFISNKKNSIKEVTIELKKRNTICGTFVRGKDYEELKEKNFWRIIMNNNLDKFSKTNDITLTRIISGLNIVRLSS